MVNYLNSDYIKGFFGGLCAVGFVYPTGNDNEFAFPHRKDALLTLNGNTISFVLNDQKYCARNIIGFRCFRGESPTYYWHLNIIVWDEKTESEIIMSI